MDDHMKMKPTVSMGLSPTGNQQMRRRTSANPLAPRRQLSFREDIEHAAAETYLVTRLTFTLIKCLGYSFYLIYCGRLRLMTKLAALACYAMFVLPGFLQGIAESFISC
ncbi:hypothetical protein QYF36_004688 [Acer negundo]|nr:hypothetical protein QYF36_004688 [Acer negundo]